MKTKRCVNIFGFTIEISRQKQTPLGPGDHPQEWPPSPWKATHQHRKGGAYRQLGDGTLEADRSAVVIYDDSEGTVWVRSKGEFHDGRFIPIANKSRGF